jgi:hypothetical protein
LGCFRSLDHVPRATKKFADVGGGASATDHGSRRGGRRRAGAARKSRLTAIAYIWNIAVMDRWVQTADVRSGRRLRWSEIQMQRTVRRQHPVLAKRLGRFHAPSTAMSGREVPGVDERPTRAVIAGCCCPFASLPCAGV